MIPIIIAYLVVVAWGIVLLVSVEHTNNTWRDLWRVLRRPLWRCAVPRAIARPRSAP